MYADVHATYPLFLLPDASAGLFFINTTTAGGLTRACEGHQLKPSPAVLPSPLLLRLSALVGVALCVTGGVGLTVWAAGVDMSAVCAAELPVVATFSGGMSKLQSSSSFSVSENGVGMSAVCALGLIMSVAGLGVIAWAATSLGGMGQLKSSSSLSSSDSASISSVG